MLQGDGFERCFAIAKDAKLLNSYLQAACWVERKPTLQGDLAITALMTSVASMQSALAWLELPDNLNGGSLQQLSQLAAALQLLDDRENLGVAVDNKIIAARCGQSDCVFYHHVLCSDAAMLLAPVADIVTQLEQVAQAGDQAPLRDIFEVCKKCEELCQGRSKLALHFGQHGSALFNAYLHQSWKAQVKQLLAPEGTQYLVHHDVCNLPALAC